MYCLLQQATLMGWGSQAMIPGMEEYCKYAMTSPFSSVKRCGLDIQNVQKQNEGRHDTERSLTSWPWERLFSLVSGNALGFAYTLAEVYTY